MAWRARLKALIPPSSFAELGKARMGTRQLGCCFLWDLWLGVMAELM
jgi:hypothetical protein